MCALMRACARTVWGRASPPPKHQRSESEKTKSEKGWENLAFPPMDLLNLLRKNLPDKTGEKAKWNFEKAHIILHKVSKIVLWGNSDNTSCQAPEVSTYVYVHVGTCFIHVFILFTHVHVMYIHVCTLYITCCTDFQHVCVFSSMPISKT